MANTTFTHSLCKFYFSLPKSRKKGLLTCFIHGSKHEDKYLLLVIISHCIEFLFNYKYTYTGLIKVKHK